MGSRNAFDFYPTPADVTQALVDYLNIPRTVTIWEPASGDGAISRVLEMAGYSVYSSDIRPEGYGDGGIDFLYETQRRGDMVITIPPFNVAEEFICKCTAYGIPFALLLKSQYFQVMSRLTLFREIPPALVLPLSWRPSFDLSRGNQPTMEFSWFVWDKSREGTRYDVLVRPDKSGQGRLFDAGDDL